MKIYALPGSSISRSRTPHTHITSQTKQPNTTNNKNLSVLLESIQWTCRLSLKMGRGDDEQKKKSDALYQTAINIDFRSSEMPPLPNNGIFKSMLDVCRSLESTLSINCVC